MLYKIQTFAATALITISVGCYSANSNQKLEVQRDNDRVDLKLYSVDSKLYSIDHWMPIGLIVDGDSISSGYLVGIPEDYASIISSVLGSRIDVTNVSVAGETFSTMLAKESSNIIPLIESYRKAGYVPVCSGFGGSNDLVPGSTKPAELLSIATEYFKACHDAGAITLGWTVLPRSSAWAFVETYTIEYNNLLRTNRNSTNIDVLIDVGSDLIFGQSSSPANSNLYIDGIHPTAYVQKIIGLAYLLPAIFSFPGSTIKYDWMKPFMDSGIAF
jgi:hypothetical protein